MKDTRTAANDGHKVWLLQRLCDAVRCDVKTGSLAVHLDASVELFQGRERLPGSSSRW